MNDNSSIDTNKTPVDNDKSTNEKRLYWLGHDTPSSQDKFFIEALDPSLWSQGDSNNWDTCWYTGMPDSDTFEQLDASKTLNHIPGNNALTIKSYLNETLVKARQHSLGTENQKRYQFFPETYSMPEDYYHFQAEAASNPDTLWIQKPKNLSRGRGIEVVKHPETVPFDPEWLIQRYLTDPHLYNGHKYVLRFYVLITSVEPLRFYLYREGFAKLASETYNETDLDNLYRHLTNPDINEENTENDVPVTFFSFEQYRQWLKGEGLDDEALFANFKDLITLTVIAAREKMRHACQAKERDTQGCYELIGLDCMVDNSLKPWILECNLSPSLDTYASAEDGANDETTIKRQLVHDLVNMLGLNNKDKLTACATAAQEKNKQGNFEQLFPGTEPNNYLSCFPVPRGKDIEALGKTEVIDYSKINLQANSDNEFLFSDSLALSSKLALNDIDNDGNNIFFEPDDIATWIWIKNSEGLLPYEIANELQALSPLPTGTGKKAHHDELLKAVWDTLSDWSQAGIFDQKPLLDKSKRKISNEWRESHHLFFGDTIDGTKVKINSSCTAAMQSIKPLLTMTPLMPQNTDLVKANTVDNCHFDISIMQTRYGYSLLCGTDIVKENLRLSELMPAIIENYFTYNSDHYEQCPIFDADIIQVKDEKFLIIRKNTTLEQNQSLYRDHISSYNHLNLQKNQLSTTLLPLKKEVETPNSIVATENERLFYLEKNINNIEHFALKGILYLEQGSGNEHTLSPLKKSTSLIKLWPHIINHQTTSKQDLAAWLESQDTIQVTLAQENKTKDTQSRELLTLLEATLTQDNALSEKTTG
ncbi:MAG: hypothetical protein ACRBBR_06275 [Cellvibrionaceae bacterium]